MTDKIFRFAVCVLLIGILSSQLYIVYKMENTPTVEKIIAIKDKAAQKAAINRLPMVNAYVPGTVNVDVTNTVDVNVNSLP